MGNTDSRITHRALLCTILMTMSLYAMLWWAAPSHQKGAQGPTSAVELALQGDKE